MRALTRTISCFRGAAMAMLMAALAACGGGGDGPTDAARVQPATALATALPSAAGRPAASPATEPAASVSATTAAAQAALPPLPDGIEAVSAPFTVGAAGAHLAQPLEVTVPIDAARLRGRPVSMLRLTADGRWETVPAPAWRTPPERPDAPAMASSTTSAPGVVVMIVQPDVVPAGAPTVTATAWVGDEQLTIDGEPTYVTTRAITAASTVRVRFDVTDASGGGGIDRVVVWQARTRLDLERPRVVWTEAGTATRIAGRRRAGTWEFTLTVDGVTSNGVYWFRGIASNARGGVGQHAWPVLVEVRIPRPPRETLYIEANRYPGTVPPEATRLTRDEFRALFDAGELKLVTAASIAADAAAPQARYDADIAALQALPERTPLLQALLDDALAHPTVEPDPVTTLPDGTPRTLLGRAATLRSALEAHRLSRDVDSQRRHYGVLYRALPAAARAGLPSPVSLEGAELDTVRAAIAAIAPLASAQPNLDNARYQPPEGDAPTRAPGDRQRAAAATPGNGSDRDATCAAPTSLHRLYWWPLKEFVSPVRNQGRRGTCWSFAAAGVIETRERVYRDNPFDMSEQFLVHKVKRDWFPDDYNEGGGGHSALNAARDNGQLLPPESFWTYNPSADRAAMSDGTAASYAGVCSGYSGTCGETSHQSELVCAGGVCATRTVAFAGPGVETSRVDPVYIRGDDKMPWNLDSLRLMLANGSSLIADMPVHIGFDEPVSGLVVDESLSTRDAKKNVVPGSRGNHVVQIVGFLSNDLLVWPGQPVPDNGGGLFIVRNSWGCGAGDGGFYYVPARYVRDVFMALYVLNVSGNRSTRWNDAQATPGARTPLAMTVSSAILDDYRTADIAPMIRIEHPEATSVQLTVTSKNQGVIYNGQWSVVGRSGLFANSLRYTPTPAGSDPSFAEDEITVTARWGTLQATGSTRLFARRPPAPVVTLTGEGTPREGEGFSMKASIAYGVDDPNRFCAATTWRVTAPDTVTGGPGCNQTVTFGTVGPRTVTVTTTGLDGRQGTGQLTVNVQAPPNNPYPRITSAVLSSRELLSPTQPQFGCAVRNVFMDTTIDLRDPPCSVSPFPPPSRYFASATVENPLGETLAYDWTVTVESAVAGLPQQANYTTRTTGPTFNWTPIAVGFLNTSYACELTLTVVAPEVARNRTRRVWSGRCINLPRGPN